MESASAKYKISKFEISLKIQFYPPKRPLRDDFLAQKYDFIRPKGPCGTLFRLKIQFDPPKRPLRDDFTTQNTILSAPKAPAGPDAFPAQNTIQIR